jgi:hypothetical protein
MPKETGMRIAIAEIGPIPGSTPTTVPQQHAEEGEGEADRLERRGEAASQINESIHARPLTQNPDGQVHREPVDERRVDHDCEDERRR